MSVSPRRLELLLRAAGWLVHRHALPAAQLAVAVDGELVVSHTWGEVPEGALFTAYSTTKALSAASVWLLLQDGRLDLDARVAGLVPGFEARGKSGVTVEHLLTHTAGFPEATLPPAEWDDRQRRLARFAAWELAFEPGARFTYHTQATHWVLAHLVEEITGEDHRAFLRERVLAPLGVTDLHLGLAPGPDAPPVVPVRHVGRPPTPGRLRRFGLRLPDKLFDEAYFESYNAPAVRALGVPSTGAVATAAALARFYQGLLGPALFDPAFLSHALRVRTGDLLDPMTGRRANRALGVVVAGDRDRVYRGFGATNSPRTFGHPGVGGQLAWADPETGLSFSFLTAGLGRDPMEVGVRMIALSTAAASLIRRGRRTFSIGSIPDPIEAFAASTRRSVAAAREYQRDPDFVRGLLPWMERFARWFDAEVQGLDNVPRDRPALLVGNHSGGVLTPDTSALMAAWYRERGVDRPLVGLGFDAAFGIPGFGQIMRRLGLVPASREGAGGALAAGHCVLVYPGGAHEVFRPWADRNRIDFGGHSGFIRLALRRGVPVVPVVGHGGHETLMVLARGEGLAELLRLDRIRTRVCPVVLQVPWGVSTPALPGLPLPAKITVRVLEPIDWSHLGPEAADDPAAVRRCYEEITGTMQATLDDLAAANPRPLLSRLRGLVRGGGRGRSA